MAGKQERIYRRKLKNGDWRYDVLVHYRDPDTGERKAKMKTFVTLKEAKAFLVEEQAEMLHGHAAAPSEMTLGQFAMEWLEARKPHLKPTTHYQYQVTVEHHIVPHLGALKLWQVTARRLEQHYAKLAAAGLGPRAVQCVHQRLVQLLRDARRRRLVRVNEAEDATPPPTTRREMHVWTDHELARFLAVADQSHYGAVWLVAVLTGMRRGELLGLRWQDVDYEASVLEVRQAMAYLRGRLVVQSTKTGRSRKVAVDDKVLAVLRAQHAQQLEWRMRAGAAWRDTGLVFTSRRGGPIDTRLLRQDFNRLSDLAGVSRLRLHELRHTHASYLLRHGEQVRAVSERLGHAKTSITLDVYSHAVPDEHHAMAERIGRLLAGS